MTDSEIYLADLEDYRFKFKKILELIRCSLDTGYTLKLIEKMVEETLKQERGGDS